MTTTLQPEATPTPVEITTTARRRGYDWRFVVGVVGVAAFVLAAVFAGLLAPYNPDSVNAIVRLQGPSGAHLLGTDDLGRDILSRILFGLRPSLEGGLAAIVLAAIGGILVGLPAGYFGHWFDEVSTRVVDLLIAWPAVFLALGLVLVLGSGESQVIIAIGLAELPVFSRLVRSIAVTNEASEHVAAARALGASHARIMRTHILPYVIVPTVVQLAISAPQALVAEASLNYLGLGSQPPHPSLGSMVSEGQNFLALSAGEVVYPIAAIVLLVICLTLLADSLQTRLDPHRQGRLT